MYVDFMLLLQKYILFLNSPINQVILYGSQLFIHGRHIGTIWEEKEKPLYSRKLKEEALACNFQLIWYQLDSFRKVSQLSFSKQENYLIKA